MTDNERYDRQIRLWGPHGQAAIQAATIVFLGSDSVASEFLKNMVLHGVGNIFVIDNAITTEKDLGTNFFVNEESLGKSRSETISVLLNELNPSSKIQAINADPNDLNSLRQIIDKLHGPECYILTSGNLKPSFLYQLADLCKENGFKQAHIQTSGFFGVFYLYGGLHYYFEGIAESKHPIEELRISNPFKDLVDFWESIDFDNLTDEQHAHIVYPAILHRVKKELLSELGVESLSKNDNYKISAKIDSLRRMKKNPSPNEDPFLPEICFDEAKDNLSKIYEKPRLSITAQDFLSFLNQNPSVYEDGKGILFWELLFATKRFYDKYGVLPHYGGCPDMEASSDMFRQQKAVYKKKSDDDWKEIADDLRSHGIDPDADIETFNRFRRNVFQVGGVLYQPIKEQLQRLPNQYMLYDSDSIRLAIVQDLFIAARNFLEENGRVPTNTPEDVQSLLAQMEKLKEADKADVPFPEQFINERPLFVKEFCRYKGEVFPSVVASFSAMLAEEITKLIIKQGNPVGGVVIYDSIHELLNVSS